MRGERTVEWAIWVGSVIFVATIAGMLWLRNRPLRDAHGNVVDELGRPVAKLSNDATVVLNALRNSREPLSGYDLRRHVTMPRQNFYAMMTELKRQHLVADQVDQLGVHNVRRYTLTHEGHALFDERAA